MIHPPSSKPLILVTGATGYVAGRLVPLLLEAGYRVRTMGRSLEKMAARPWGNQVQLVRGNIMDPASLARAAQGCTAVYYLVHSMISRKGRYREADKIGARNMARAAAKAGVEQIIYLGGLGEANHPHISKHLISRNEVGRILAQGPVPVTVLRAAMIIGSGSASFEILRYLSERLPVMITPKWVRNPTQPIAISNVLHYLLACLDHPETRGKTFDIGGPDVVTYQDLFKIFARQSGIPVPVMLPVPVLSPRFSALWIHLITPVPANIAQPLAEGLRLPTVCTEDSIQKIIPQELLSCNEAIRRAMERVNQEKIDTCWADAGEIVHPEWTHCGDSDYSGGTVLECGYQAKLKGRPEDLWPAVARLGGETGYYAADILWQIRGMMDVFSGGVGLNRGRRDREEIRVGDSLDFWRVMEVSSPHRLILLAEMKVPGEAMLEVKIEPLGRDEPCRSPSGPPLITASDHRDHCCVTLHSRFLPAGVFGIIYWYILYPLHEYVFSRMLRGMIRSAGLPMVGRPWRFTPKISPALRRKSR